MHPALQTFFERKISFSSEHEELVSRCFKQKITRRNEILVPQGSIAKHIYFVAKGCLRVFLTRANGSESTRVLIFEGRMGTAFPSFILRQPSSACVQSLEPSELLLLNYEDRLLLQKEVPGWETMDRIAVERAYIEAIQRIEGFITMDARARYAVLLQNNPEMVLRLPSKIVADYLGISHETLSRLKGKP